MDKKTLQEQELDRVSGGRARPSNDVMKCASCKSEYHKMDHYPNGFLFKTESHGCSSTYYFKCPGCGYEWRN